MADHFTTKKCYDFGVGGTDTRDVPLWAGPMQAGYEEGGGRWSQNP